jgi:hypothetical protein
MVMVDFEFVDFKEPDSCFSEGSTQREYIDRSKETYLRRWLENMVV